MRYLGARARAGGKALSTEMIGDQPAATLQEPLAESWMVAYRLVLQAGRLVVAEVRVFPQGAVPRGGLTRRLLKTVTMGAHLDRSAEVTRSLIGLLRRFVGQSAPADDTTAIRQQLQLLTAPRGGRWADPRGATASRRGRKPISDDVLGAVARIYFNALSQHRPPVLAVVNEWDLAKPRTAPATPPMSRARARDLVRRARRRGFLTDTKQGRRGGKLTDEYRQIFRRRRR
jgi:hypothetical protein